MNITCVMNTAMLDNVWRKGKESSACEYNRYMGWMSTFSFLKLSSTPVHVVLTITLEKSSSRCHLDIIFYEISL